jgi:prepilin-type N-terminal cleavage/methylation domain-containing protein/prepilin-type processing-associated H-X9-DG protein
MRGTRDKKGFTLVELLVVILIISILISLLLPAINNAIKQAQKTQCSNNVRQQTLAWLLYLSDWDQTFPEADLCGDWQTMLCDGEAYGGPAIRFGGVPQIKIHGSGWANWSGSGSDDPDDPPPWCWLDMANTCRQDDLDSNNNTGFRVQARGQIWNASIEFIAGNEDPILGTYVNNEERIFECPSARQLWGLPGAITNNFDREWTGWPWDHRFAMGNDYCYNFYIDASVGADSPLDEMAAQGFLVEGHSAPTAANWGVFQYWGQQYHILNLRNATIGGVANASKVWVVTECIARVAPYYVFVGGGSTFGVLSSFNLTPWSNPMVNVSWHDQVRPMCNFGFLDGHVEYLELEELEAVHTNMTAGGALEYANPTHDALQLLDTVDGARYWGDPARLK